MRAKTRTCGGGGKAKAVTQFPKACIREKRQEERECQRRQREAQIGKTMEYQGRRPEANREKRQELARLRHEASLDKVGQPKHRHKAADRERLKGKGLFYCESPQERLKEIQRRFSEANRENPEESRQRRQANR